MENLKKATFGGGCFWCTEAVFLEVQGVTSVESGYAGGHKPNPTYREICEKTTGHAEVIQITYDENQVSYRELLEIFFATHDPTTMDRQGNDRGPQYRSIILFHDEGQREIAEDVKQGSAADLWDDPIVTEIKALEIFYPAEKYHQDYYARNSYQPYCVAVINPKLSKFRANFKSKLKTNTSNV